MGPYTKILREQLSKGKKAQMGEISTHADGSKWKKTARGWVRVSEGRGGTSQSKRLTEATLHDLFEEGGAKLEKYDFNRSAFRTKAKNARQAWAALVRAFPKGQLTYDPRSGKVFRNGKPTNYRVSN